MLEEAEAFSIQLKDFQRAVGDYHRNVQSFMRGLLPLLESNLPRVWTAVPETAGLAEPVRPSISHGHPSRVGGDFDGAAIMAHMDILDRSIEEEILAPLRRWQEGLQVARERMKSLDKLRREVDGQRKKYEKKFRRSEQRLRRAYLGAGFGSSSSSSDDDDVVPRGKLLEDYQRLALHTERQLRAIVESYEDQERLVWEQLSGLVTDAAWLESYAAATMIKAKEAMQGVAVALGPSKQPLPAYRPKPGMSSSVPYGEVGANIKLIKQMSPRALELASGALPRGAAVLPYQPLRAKRGTATPLLVAAAAAPGSGQRLLAAEPVPTVQLGASGVPMDMVPRDVADRAIRDVERRAAGEGVHVREMPPPAFLSSSSSAAAEPSETTAAYPGLPAPTAAAGGGGTGGSVGLRPRDQGLGAAREGGKDSEGFREGDRDRDTLGFRDTGRQSDSLRFSAGGKVPMGFREADRDRDDLGFKERAIQGAEYRDQGFRNPEREPSLAYGIRDADATPPAAAAAAAAAAAGPMEGEVITDAARSAGHETTAPVSRVYDDTEGRGQGFRSEGIRPMGAAAAKGPVAAAMGGENTGYERRYEPSAAAAMGGENAGFERRYERPAVGSRSDDVLDSFATPLKMTAAEAAATSAARAPAGVGRDMTGAAGGVGSSDSSGEFFQDARSEVYPSRGSTAAGYEATPINSTAGTAMNGTRATGGVADAPYSPGSVGLMTKQQQQQVFDRPMGVVQ
jgi:hypothetical protein